MGTYRAKYSFKQIPIHIFFGFLIALTFVAIGATKFRDPIELLLIFISFGAFFTIVLIFYQYIGNVFTKLKINSEYIAPTIDSVK